MVAAGELEPELWLAPPLLPPAVAEVLSHPPPPPPVDVMLPKMELPPLEPNLAVPPGPPRPTVTAYVPTPVKLSVRTPPPPPPPQVKKMLEPPPPPPPPATISTLYMHPEQVATKYPAPVKVYTPMPLANEYVNVPLLPVPAPPLDAKGGLGGGGDGDNLGGAVV